MPKEPAADRPEAAEKPMQHVMQGLMKELARLDKDVAERAQAESELASGSRPTYRVSDVKVHLAGRARADDGGFSLVSDEFDVTIDFNIRETHGGEFGA